MKQTVFAHIQKSASPTADATFVMSAADIDRTRDTIDPAAYNSNTGKRLIALWQHDHSQPVGYWENLRKQGKQFIGDLKLASTNLASMIKQLLADDVPLMASIGFSSTDAEPNKHGGNHFKQIDIYECSIVSVGAHPQAVRIAKSFGFDVVQDGKTVSFVKALAAQGNGDGTVKNQPRALGKTVSINPQGQTKMSFAEQIKGFKARKIALQDTVKSLLQKSADEGRTLDAEEAAKHDEAVEEITQVEKHLARLESAEAMAIAGATPVAGGNQKAASASRGGVITVKDNLPQGVEFARYAKCLAKANGNLMQAEQIAKHDYPEMARIHTVMKAAVAAGTTTDATWASPLVDYQNFAGDFISFLRPKTIIGRFGQGGVPSLRMVPFNIKIAGQSSGGSAGWVGEGKAKPVTKFDFNDVTLGWAKLAAISVLTNELIRFSSPAADVLVRDSLAEALIARKDLDFVDPTKAAVAGVSPASITNGVTAVTASGTDEAAVKADVKALMTKFIAAKLSLSQGVWIMSPGTALTLGMMSNALGQPSFPGITMSGGVFFGLPVIVSEHIPDTNIILTAANEIYLAEDAVMVSASREASIEMSDAPTGSSGTPTGASLVSMFATNSTALLVEQYTNWSKRRSAAAQYIEAAAYEA